MCKKILLEKSIEFEISLKENATCYKNFSLPDPRLAENLIFVFDFYEQIKQGYMRICN